MPCVHHQGHQYKHSFDTVWKHVAAANSTNGLKTILLLLVLTWGCGGPPLRFLSLLPLERRALHAHRFTTSCWKFVALWLLLSQRAARHQSGALHSRMRGGVLWQCTGPQPAEHVPKTVWGCVVTLRQQIFQGLVHHQALCMGGPLHAVPPPVQVLPACLLTQHRGVLRGAYVCACAPDVLAACSVFADAACDECLRRCACTSCYCCSW